MQPPPPPSPLQPPSPPPPPAQPPTPGDYALGGWGVDKSSGRLVFPPYPEAAPQVFAPDSNCAGGRCGVGPASIKLPIALASAKAAPVAFTPPDCMSNSAQRKGCVTVPAGLSADQMMLGLKLPGKGPTDPTFSISVAGFTGQVAWPVLGDLNGDGFLDVLINERDALDANKLVPWINDGRGSFSVLSTGSFTSAGAFSSGEENLASLGDANGDGHLDVLTASHKLFLNDGSALFTQAAFPEYEVPSAYQSMSGGFSGGEQSAWGDADGDGHLDVFTHKLHLNDGSGSFAEAIGGPESLPKGQRAWADANGDGFLDLAQFQIEHGELTLYLNDGNGALTRIDAFQKADDDIRMYPTALAWGDCNGDGFAGL